MKSKIIITSAVYVLLIFIVIAPITSKSASFLKQEPLDSATDVKDILGQGYAIEKSLPTGYKTDGSMDYTSYLQSALDKYSKIIFPAFPILISDKGLTLHNGQKIYFKKGSKLILSPSHQGSYQILRIHDVSHISLYGLFIQGDKYNHFDNKGEWGMGISIRGANDITISSAKIEKCWGDGIYIGGTTTHSFSSELNLRYITCNDNRRNGISVISARNLTFQSPVLSNTSGTPPMCGLDLEPNNNSDVLDGIKILDAVTSNNQYGISFYLTPLNGTNPQTTNISILNHRDEGSKWAMQFGSKGDHIKGQVTIESSHWDNSPNGVKIINYEPFNGAQVIFKNVKVTRSQNGSTQEIQNQVFSNLKRSIKPEHTGVLIK
jgi:hypothetical protein